MTQLDRDELHPGYWNSPWPWSVVVIVAKRAAHGALDAASGQAQVTTRVNGRWNVMAIRREPGEWFVGGTMRRSPAHHHLAG